MSYIVLEQNCCVNVLKRVNGRDFSSATWFFFILMLTHSISCSLSLRVKGTFCWRNKKWADEERIKRSRLSSLDLNPV